MHIKLFSSVVATVLLCVTATAFAVGEAGVPSQIIPPGARANGMGESYVAIADDATAAWWNPGGLAFLRGRNLALMHSQLVPDLASDVYYEFLGFTNEISGVGTLSIAVIYLTYGTSVATNTQGEKKGEFKSWEASGVVSFAIPLSDNIGLGLSGKFIHADLAPANLTLEQLDGTGSSVAVDAGMLWKIPQHKLSFGAALTNLGPDISFIDQEQSDPLPFTLRLGVGYRPIQDDVNSFLMTFDFEQSLVWLIDSATKTRRSEIYHMGVEYRYINLLAGRLGYVYDEDGDFKDFTYGLGFIYKGRVALDYANVPQAQTLDRVHRWSVSVSF
ncbi:MAG: PorV/PorQ family protein [Candidatus Latescibacterota bacterium]|nr:MAG: PorV/PorQ family protein [Candidatus Latescibacterota bacterium]